MTYRFTFLRHGESTGNRDGYIQGQHDFPLSPVGIEQIEQLSATWQDQGFEFDSVISSPLSRARETADIIQSIFDIPVIYDDIWMERDWGNYQGLSIVEFNQKISKSDSLSIYKSLGGKGESDWQLLLRAGRAVQSLFSNPPGNYLIVSHGGLLNKVFHIIFGIRINSGFQGLYFYLNNTTYTNVEYHPERNQWQMHDFIQPDFVEGTPFNSPSNYRFTFTRHAESQGNVDKVFQGQSETPLTELGLKQAQNLGTHFSSNQKNFDKAYSSPQLRARQTAEMICSPLNLKIETSHLLKEINNGKLAGLNGDEINAQYPERPDRTNPYLPVGEDGESWLELYLRGMQVLDLLFTNPSGSYLIVSHGAILNAIIWGIVGIQPQPSRRSAIFRFENTGSCEMVYLPHENTWHFISLNPLIHGLK